MLVERDIVSFSDARLADGANLNMSEDIGIKIFNNTNNNNNNNE
jgi:hypothetical protein